MENPQRVRSWRRQDQLASERDHSSCSGQKAQGADSRLEVSTGLWEAKALNPAGPEPRQLWWERRGGAVGSFLSSLLFVHPYFP